MRQAELQASTARRSDQSVNTKRFDMLTADPVVAHCSAKNFLREPIILTEIGACTMQRIETTLYRDHSNNHDSALNPAHSVASQPPSRPISKIEKYSTQNSWHSIRFPKSHRIQHDNRNMLTRRIPDTCEPIHDRPPSTEQPDRQFWH